MAEEQKKTRGGFLSYCEGTPCEEMMRKMLEARKSGQPFPCAERMSQMMQICCGTKEKKEEPTQGSQENPAANP